MEAADTRVGLIIEIYGCINILSCSHTARAADRQVIKKGPEENFPHKIGIKEKFEKAHMCYYYVYRVVVD